MPPDLSLLSTLIGSNYLCLELIFMAPKVFEPLKFDCTMTMEGWKRKFMCNGTTFPQRKSSPVPSDHQGPLVPFIPLLSIPGFKLFRYCCIFLEPESIVSVESRSFEKMNTNSYNYR